MDFLRLSEDAQLPQRQHPGDAGLDLFTTEEVLLAPLQRKLVHTGVACAIPQGHVGLVCPRSGLAAKMGVTVLNGPGIVDCGYRGEIGVVLINLSNENATLEKGSRIAQLVVVPFAEISPNWAQSLDDTSRGAGGFGSTK